MSRSDAHADSITKYQQSKNHIPSVQKMSFRNRKAHTGAQMN